MTTTRREATVQIGTTVAGLALAGPALAERPKTNWRDYRPGMELRPGDAVKVPVGGTVWVDENGEQHYCCRH